MVQTRRLGRFVCHPLAKCSDKLAAHRKDISVELTAAMPARHSRELFTRLSKDSLFIFGEEALSLFGSM
jgi:hypothetical protein